MSGGPLLKKPPENLRPKEWIAAVRLEFQQQIVTFLLTAYGFLLIATMLMFFLQGFHVAGFMLEPSLLKWLGIATIGEIGGLLTLTFRAAFR